MIFATVIILLVGVIAFFHFIQGFFSATLSAIFVVIAAVFAFAWHETIVESLLGGKIADEAHALILLALFAVIYLVLRTIFDNLVPGNVRLPVTVDKAGAAVMGIVAGLFAAGVLAVAAQEMPFGPNVAGYARYDVGNHPAVFTDLNGRGQDSMVWDGLTTDKPGDWGTQHSLLIPVDDLLIGTVQKLSSAGGSLDDGRPLDAIHPDYLQELFGQRAGIEIGGTRVATDLAKQRLEAVKLVGLYTIPRNIPEKDPEYPKVRSRGALKPDVTPNNGQEFLVVRVMFNKSAADADGIVRFGLGACRLVVPQRGGDEEWTDVYPVGTLGAKEHTLYLNKLDDYLYVNVKDADRGADLVFIVDKGTFDKGAPQGSFIEVKRLARMSLAGMQPKGEPQPDPNVGVMRKPLALDPKWNPLEERLREERERSAQQQASAQPAAPEVKASFQYAMAAVSSELPVPITAPAGATGFTQVPGGTAALKGGKADAVEVTSAAAAQTQGQSISQAYVPAGKVMVKVSGSPAAGASSPWQCVTDANQIELVDSTGKKYQPYGVYASYSGGAAQKFLLQYVTKDTLSGVAQPPDASGGPTQVVLMYLVPQGTTLNELDDHQQKIQQLSLTANK